MQLPKNQQGALLIEAMVALAIFSIAMLSLAGAQITSSKNTFSSLLKTESAVRSSEIIDMMRMNLGGVTAGDYDIAYNATLPSTPSSQGGLDVKNWILGLQNEELRGTSADGAIACIGLSCNIEIRWNDGRADEDENDTYTYSTDVNL